MPAEATMFLRRVSFPLLCVLLLEGITAAQSQHPAQPKIRTITAFVRLDRAAYRAQVEDALKMLRAAKGEFTKAGYEVETIRITSQPFPEYTSGLPADQVLEFFRQYDKLAQHEGFTPDIGPAMSKDSDDPKQAELLARILASTESINGFIVVADEQGIHWHAIQAAAKVIKSLEEQTARSEGNFRFAAGAFPPQNAPFFPVSSTGDAGHGFAIGLESANVAGEAFASAQGDLAVAGERLTAALAVQAKRVEEIARRLEKQSGWEYRGIDLTPVPLKDVSIGAAMESALGKPLGVPGSLSVAYAITSAVRRVPVQQTGYSGLMLPVLEDSVLAQRWEAGAISRDALMSYSSVCSTGLDAVPLPGDTSQRELESIIADMASLAVKWHKPLSARLLPVTGKKGGEMTEFSSPYLANIHIR
ncbi:MAG TPA: DUF711 family protein [Candidatus Angelobacter sp.]|nr:DUF711 family protein [Candidatus Angelobacter sp.]